MSIINYYLKSNSFLNHLRHFRKPKLTSGDLGG